MGVKFPYSKQIVENFNLTQQTKMLFSVIDPISLFPLLASKFAIIPQPDVASSHHGRHLHGSLIKNNNDDGTSK